MTVSTESNPELPDAVRPYWTDCGIALRKFNNFVVNDPRVDVTMLPLFDGVSMIKWKVNESSTNGSAANGNSLNDFH